MTEIADIESPIKKKITLPKSEEVSNSYNTNSDWKGYQKVAFRIFFIFAFLLSFPLHHEFYEYFGKITWSELNCRDLFIIATYRTIDFVTITSESGKWGILSYINFFITFGIAVVGGSIWTYFDKGAKEYNKLNYWIRVLIRYRVGIGIVAWGFRKLLPGQMVLPTVTILNTPLIDFQAQKLYWQSAGIVPTYQVFLGGAEFIAGFLLLFRKTTPLGAALTAVLLGNIVIANHVYDGSVHLHSACYTILAVMLLWQYLPDIWNLIAGEKDITPYKFYPVIEGWVQYIRVGLKAFTFVVFVGLFCVLQIDDYINAPYRIPDTVGLANTQGYYAVTSFKKNNQELPYNPLDPVRWQDAIFESWSTISFKVNRASVMDQSNGGGYSKKDIERTWELAGIGGGRRYFYYEADTVKHQLKLFNKNEKHKEEQLVLNYSKPSDTRIILFGVNELKDSIYVILDKQEQNYPVLQGYKNRVASLPYTQ